MDSDRLIHAPSQFPAPAGYRWGAHWSDSVYSGYWLLRTTDDEGVQVSIGGLPRRTEQQALARLAELLPLPLSVVDVTPWTVTIRGERTATLTWDQLREAARQADPALRAAHAAALQGAMVRCNQQWSTRYQHAAGVVRDIVRYRDQGRYPEAEEAERTYEALPGAGLMDEMITFCRRELARVVMS